MNKLTIIGNATSDATLRTTQSGVSVCSFTVAVNPTYKKENGDNSPQYFKVTAWRKLGENCAKYITKGMKVCVVGPVELQTFTNNNGESKASIAVTADDVEFLSRSDHHADATQEAPEPQTKTTGTPSYTDVSADFDNELPF